MLPNEHFLCCEMFSDHVGILPQWTLLNRHVPEGLLIALMYIRSALLLDSALLLSFDLIPRRLKLYCCNESLFLLPCTWGI